MCRKKIKMWRIWSAMRDAGLRFCQNEAVLVRIDLDVMETHKKALKTYNCMVYRPLKTYIRKHIKNKIFRVFPSDH